LVAMDIRHLRPLFLDGDGDGDGDVVWAVDEFQPVAALLDATSGALVRLVSWPDLPPPSVGETVQVVAAASGLWVQPGPGAPVARIDRQGMVQGGYSAGRRLVAAEQRGAWCVGEQPQLLTSDPQWTPEPLSSDAIFVIAANGDTRRVEVDRPVRAVHVAAEGGEAVVYLVVDDAPHTVRELGASTWEVRWRQAWLRVPPGPVPARLYLADAEVERPVLPPRRAAGAQSWHRGVADPARAGVRAGRRWWLAGADLEHSDAFDRRLVLTGHREGESQPLRIDLGSGHVRAMLGGDTGLWLAVRRRVAGGDSSAAPVELLRVDADSGSVSTVMSGADFDVSGQCWPLGRPPIDAESYASYQRDRYAELDTAWRQPVAGTTKPLAEHTSRWSSTLAGSWPETRLILSFDHRRYPGLRLRRRVRLFDELGRLDPPEFADIQLMEDIETGRIPPTGEAVDGLLDV
jgi:hypothetical protein